ncbi:MAG: hypothetical protein GXO89_03960 [Chlorobi bacterium]|nr:hypothetical protein [Chlorobiota bacterium]
MQNTNWIWAKAASGLKGCTTNLHPLIQKQNIEADIISTFTQQQTGIEASSENPKGVGATKLGIAQ